MPYDYCIAVSSRKAWTKVLHCASVGTDTLYCTWLGAEVKVFKRECITCITKVEIDNTENCPTSHVKAGQSQQLRRSTDLLLDVTIQRRHVWLLLSDCSVSRRLCRHV